MSFTFDLDLTWPPEVRAPLSADGTSTHALVIHADRDLRDMLDIYLLSAGYVVSAAADGPAASRQLDGRTPDLIVLDTSGSDLEDLGFVFAGPGKRRGKFIPILYITAEKGAAARAESLGVVACLTQPFSPDFFLKSAMRCLLGGAARGKSLRKAARAVAQRQADARGE